MKISKKRYIQTFLLVVILLAILKTVFPEIAADNNVANARGTAGVFSVEQDDENNQQPDTMPQNNISRTYARFFNADGTEKKHRIRSVRDYGEAFPDQNDVQLASAQLYGVAPVQDREEAEKRKNELVYVGSNPYYYIEPLKQSIPYLVPRAAVLLQEIGRNFFDSLTVKGIPLHKVIVTSVMRSKEDVNKLRGHNRNATVNSCHLYGTTFDVCYNRYKTVEAPGGTPRRKVRNDSLKWVLSEVLNDMRLARKCHIKYEVHQGCFHITVN